MNNSLYGSAWPKISSSPNYKTENDIRWTTEKKEIMDWAQQQTGRKLGKVSESYFHYVSSAFCNRNADYAVWDDYPCAIFSLYLMKLQQFWYNLFFFHSTEYAYTQVWYWISVNISNISKVSLCYNDENNNFPVLVTYFKKQLPLLLCS